MATKKSVDELVAEYKKNSEEMKGISESLRENFDKFEQLKPLFTPEILALTMADVFNKPRYAVNVLYKISLNFVSFLQKLNVNVIILFRRET